MVLVKYGLYFYASAVFFCIQLKLSCFFITNLLLKFVRYGCCSDESEAKGPEKEGCPETSSK